MKVINIQAAKTHLSRIVEEAAAGEEIILAKAGKPLVRIIPWPPLRTAKSRSRPMRGLQMMRSPSQ